MKLYYKKVKIYLLNNSLRECKIENEYHKKIFIHFHSYLSRGLFSKIHKRNKKFVNYLNKKAKFN